MSSIAIVKIEHVSLTALGITENAKVGPNYEIHIKNTSGEDVTIDGNTWNGILYHAARSIRGDCV